MKPENQPRTGDQTRPEQQESEDGLVPRTPNERDTSADSQSASQSGSNAVGKAAHKDAVGVQQDTDKGPLMDKVYNDKVRDGAPKDGPRR